MKTKMMKRAAAFAASVLMTAAMAVPVSANSNPDPVPVNTQMSGKPKAFTELAENHGISIPKRIWLFNPDSKDVYAPNITYNYQLAKVENPNAKVSGLTWDAVNKKGVDPEVSVTVKDGVDNKIRLVGTADGDATDAGNTADLKFGTQETKKKYSTKPEGEVSADDTNFVELALKVEQTAKFDKAGVYRYTLTETTTNAEKTTYGVHDIGKDADAQPTDGVRYLDVYVDAAGDVYGYVLADTAESYDYDATADEQSKKVDKLDDDFYSTYNVKVQKNITGDMADKEHAFPIDVQLKAAEGTTLVGTAEIWAEKKENHGTVVTEWASDTTENEMLVSGYGTQIYSFADTDFIQLYGLPENYQVVVDEENNTGDTYTVTVKETRGNSIRETISAQQLAGGKKLSAIADETVREFAVAASTAGQSEIIEITNSLDLISPTGVLFRIAPYALMMTAGGVLIAVYLRGKKREDAESMI